MLSSGLVSEFSVNNRRHSMLCVGGDTSETPPTDDVHSVYRTLDRLNEMSAVVFVIGTASLISSLLLNNCHFPSIIFLLSIVYTMTFIGRPIRYGGTGRESGPDCMNWKAIAVVTAPEQPKTRPSLDATSGLQHLCTC